MGNNMRYLIAIFVLFFSAFSFADSMPSCTFQAVSACTTSTNAPCTSTGGLIHVGTISNCSTAYPSAVKYICAKLDTCSCPSGQHLNTVTQGSTTTTSCIPDDPPAPDTCPAGQVYYESFCRDSANSPSECGANYSTAIAVGDVYVCANSGCPTGTNASGYTNANGSWNVCSPSGDSSSAASASAPSDDSGGSNSSSASQDTTSGGDSSDGNGSGSGGGGGTEGGSGTDSQNTQSSSSTPSSAHGATSSGDGAGNCDPTAENYMECITRQSPGYDIGEKGEFDGLAAEQYLQELQQEYVNAVQNIKNEMQQQLGGDISGSGTITDTCQSIRGVQVCFGMGKWIGDLNVIGGAVMLVAAVLSFVIVMRR